MPERLWDQLKVEADVADRHVDIVEVRQRWDGAGEHTRLPIARLPTPRAPVSGRSTGAIANLKFHEYERKRPNKNVQLLLDWIEDSGDPIFWGWRHALRSERKMSSCLEPLGGVVDPDLDGQSG